MRTILSICITLLLLLGAAACTSKSQPVADDQALPKKAKVLVLYYSQNGATKEVAEQLKHIFRANIEEIELEKPYSGTFEETIARCMKENADSIVPKIKPIKSDISKYDIIFLGYPIWFGSYAQPIKGLVKAYDFNGKMIVPFCTFGSGGLEQSTADLAKALPQAVVVDGYGVRNARISEMPDELMEFLKEKGFIDGEIDELPEFSALTPVNESDSTIFAQACGDYQFPLGTPVSVAKRETKKATEYKYIAASKDAEGNDTKAVIYVTVKKGDNAKPVFTKVVR